MNECLACGNKDVNNLMVHYFVVPGFIMVPNSYLLCDKHSGAFYSYEDIYDNKGNRKKIDHNDVLSRVIR